MIVYIIMIVLNYVKSGINLFYFLRYYLRGIFFRVYNYKFVVGGLHVFLNVFYSQQTMLYKSISCTLDL